VWLVQVALLLLLQHQPIWYSCVLLLQLVLELVLVLPLLLLLLIWSPSVKQLQTFILHIQSHIRSVMLVVCEVYAHQQCAA
jgi:hypothetical protein